MLLNPFLRLKQKLTKMNPGLIKADSANLPRIDLLMIGEFLASNKDFCSAEFRNVKTSKILHFVQTLILA